MAYSNQVQSTNSLLITLLPPNTPHHLPPLTIPPHIICTSILYPSPSPSPLTSHPHHHLTHLHSTPHCPISPPRHTRLCHHLTPSPSFLTITSPSPSPSPHTHHQLTPSPLTITSHSDLPSPHTLTSHHHLTPSPKLLVLAPSCHPQRAVS